MSAAGEHRGAISAAATAQLVAFMWVAFFLNYCDRQAISAMFPVLRTDLGMSDAQLGLTGSIFLWVYGVCCPLAGQLADVTSRRMLVVASLVLWSIVTLCTGLAGSAAVLLALRAAMGVSEALYMPAAVALTANATSLERRSRAVATLTTAQVAGTVGGSWFGGWMAQQGQWREAFFVLGAVGLLYAIPYHLFLRGVAEQASATAPTASGRLALAELFRIPTYRVLCTIFPLFLFGLWMLYAWLPNFLYEKFALDLAEAGFTAGVYLQTGALIGLLGGGVLADRLYARTKAARLWLLTATLLLCAPCLHLVGNSATLAATCYASAGFGLFSGFLMGNIFPAAFEITPAETRSSAVGCLNFCGAVVSGFAPLVGGMCKESLGIEGLLSGTAIVYLAAGILLILSIRVLFPQDYARVHGEFP